VTSRTNNLKFLHSAVSHLLVCAVFAALTGCAGRGHIGSPGPAERFAVELANDACQRDFGNRPFRTGEFQATRSGDRWLWGWLDPAKCGGYSAQVSFRADKSEAEVRVSRVDPDRLDFEEPDAPSLDRELKKDSGSGPLTQQPEPSPPGP
jgi:hypothetical protein